MTSTERTSQAALLFAGDHSDELVRSISFALTSSPDGLTAIDWPEGKIVPDPLIRCLTDGQAIRRILIHRRSLGPFELMSISQIRKSFEPARQRPHFELIVGELVRYADLHDASTLVDRIMPESTAAEVLAALVTGQGPQSNVGTPVGVLSSNRPLAEVLRDQLSVLDYRPQILNGWSDPALPPGALLIWDVPLLSDRWQIRLRDQSRRRPILTLLGFADRTLVQLARDAGAVACLEMPYEFDHFREAMKRHAIPVEPLPIDRNSMAPDRLVRRASLTKGRKDRTDSAHARWDRSGSHPHLIEPGPASPDTIRSGGNLEAAES